MPKKTKRPQRPRWRSDCEDAPRPCPFVGCRYHLSLEVTGKKIRRNFSTVSQLALMADTCALDVADRGAHTGVAVGRMLGLSKTAVSRVELRAIAKLGRHFRSLPDDVVQDVLPLLRRMLKGDDE